MDFNACSTTVDKTSFVLSSGLSGPIMFTCTNLKQTASEKHYFKLNSLYGLFLLDIDTQRKTRSDAKKPFELFLSEFLFLPPNT